MRFTSRNVCLMAVLAFASACVVVVDAVAVNNGFRNSKQGVEVGQDECFHFGGHRSISGGSPNNGAAPFVVISDVPVIINRVSDGITSGRSGPPWPISNGVTFVVKSNCSNGNLLSSNITPTVDFTNINGFDGNNGVPEFTINAIPTNTPAGDLNNSFLESSTYTFDSECSDCSGQSSSSTSTTTVDICAFIPTFAGCESDDGDGPTPSPTPSPTPPPTTPQPLCENANRRLRSGNGGGLVEATKETTVQHHHDRRELDDDNTCTINVEITYWGCENEIYVAAPDVTLKDNADRREERTGCNCQSQLTFVDLDQSPSPPVDPTRFNVITDKNVGGTNYKFVEGGEDINTNCAPRV